MDMLELQQQNLQQNFPEKKLLKLDIDAGGVQARRIIERMIKQEQTTQSDDVSRISARG
jgi:vanillate O-demethylase monooxygenase subunit